MAILGRPREGDAVSGDDAAFVEAGGALLLGVADGLGHGPAAREPSARAVAVLRARAHLPPSALLDPCAEAVAGTRGAVMAVTRLALDGLVEHACVGNIVTHLWGQKGVQHMPCRPGVLGVTGRRTRDVVGTRKAMRAGDVLIMTTDGFPSRLNLAEALRRQHPLLIAAHLLRAFGRSHDDALVRVAS